MKILSRQLIYAGSFREEDGTEDFNLRIISMERMEKRWDWFGELNVVERKFEN